MRFQYAAASIEPLDRRAMAIARGRWNAIAKPINGLGVLEDLVVRLAGMYGTDQVVLDKRAVVACCADNGVVEEGVTQTGQEVTRIVAANMLNGTASVSRMAEVANVEVVPVDVGMLEPVPGVLDRRIAAGTANIGRGPAMTAEEADRAIEVGIDLAIRLKSEGYNLLIAGEMGIGNTTTSSAVTSSLLGLPPALVTGRGAGLSTSGYERKVAVIEHALSINTPNPSDAFDVVRKVGGFDIAALAGLYVGAAVARVPVLIDGCISAVAALVAKRLCPACASYMVATHESAEPAFGHVMDELGQTPIIRAGMHLGEGTGAVCLVPLLDMALALYNEGDSFDELGMEAYEVNPW